MFVVARLAARHGIRVRLQQAEFGGLTALVWLPDEVLIHHVAAAPSRLSGSGGAGPRRGSHEAAGDLGRGTVERSAATARSAELTSPREDAQGAQLGRRLISDAGRGLVLPDRRTLPGRLAGRPARLAGRPARLAGRPARLAGRPARDRRAVRPRLAGVGQDRYVAARFCSVRRRSALELWRQVPQAARSSRRRPKRGGCPSSTRSRRAGLAAAARRPVRPASPQRPAAAGRHQQMKAGVPQRRSRRRSRALRRQRGCPSGCRTRIWSPVPSRARNPSCRTGQLPRPVTGSPDSSKVSAKAGPLPAKRQIPAERTSP